MKQIYHKNAKKENCIRDLFLARIGNFLQAGSALNHVINKKTLTETD